MRSRFKWCSIPRGSATRSLLDYFFRMHDPTTLNQQHNDVGTQYRSAIFYTTDDQKKDRRAGQGALGQVRQIQPSDHD